MMFPFASLATTSSASSAEPTVMCGSHAVAVRVFAAPVKITVLVARTVDPNETVTVDVPDVPSLNR